jgi:Coenzyme PQQ synthesis protein D (PqqD)
MNGEISEHSTVVASKDQVSSDLGEGEVAILNLRRGTYYGLDAVGTRVWNLLQEPGTVREIRNVLLNEYDVEPERCERDLLALLQKLADEGLVEIRD